jgi:hypothetical protein
MKKKPSEKRQKNEIKGLIWMAMIIRERNFNTNRFGTVTVLSDLEGCYNYVEYGVETERTRMQWSARETKRGWSRIRPSG